jgi:hypothetical protein
MAARPIGLPDIWTMATGAAGETVGLFVVEAGLAYRGSWDVRAGSPHDS